MRYNIGIEDANRTSTVDLHAILRDTVARVVAANCPQQLLYIVAEAIALGSGLT